MAAVDKGADREMENVSFLEEAVGGLPRYSGQLQGHQRHRPIWRR